MSEQLPELIPAVTASYRFHHRLHACRADDREFTLCGRRVHTANEAGVFSVEEEGVCLRCIQSIEVMRRTHEGFLP